MRVESLDELDFNIDPELDEFTGQIKLDTDLITEIELAIATVLVLLEIEGIDKNTYSRIVNICLKDEKLTTRCYNNVYLQNLIESELTNMLKNGR
jgi:hypothetical protein